MYVLATADRDVVLVGYRDFIMERESNEMMTSSNGAWNCIGGSLGLVMSEWLEPDRKSRGEAIAER